MSNLRSDPGPPLRSVRTPLGAIRRADAELRRIVVSVRAWGLEVGRACSTDALTAIVGVTVDEARGGRASPKCWTAERVSHVLATGVSGFCADREVCLPQGLTEAMVLWLGYLDTHGALGRGSDPVERLLEAAAGRSGRPLQRRARSTGHPASGGRG